MEHDHDLFCFDAFTTKQPDEIWDVRDCHAQTSYTPAQRYPGCTCQYGPMTPRWYISVASCPLHKSQYRADETPPQMDYYGATQAGREYMAAERAKRDRKWWQK